MTKYSKILTGLVIVFTLFSFRWIGENWLGITVTKMGTKIKAIESFYISNKNYSVSLTHATFKNYTTNTSVEQKKGFYIRSNKNYHSYAMGIHSIQNAKYKLTVDSLNKMIIINNPDKDIAKQVKISEIEQYLKVCENIRVANQNGTEKYRFDFSKTNTYSAYEIWTGEDSRIEKIIMYFNTELPSDPQDEKSVKTKPRAEIIFSNYQLNVEFDYKKYFDESKYVVFKNNAFTTTEKYKNCIIYDLRIEK